MFAVLGIFSLVAVATVTAGEKSYTSRWDNVDVEKILRNERLLRSYFRCIMEQGRCTTDAAELKKNLSEALANQCTKCTEKQKTNLDKVMKYLYDKRQEMFSQVEKKYDPEGTYRKRFQEGKEASKPTTTVATTVKS